MADTYLTEHDEQRIKAAVDDYAASKGILDGGAKDIFCQYWPKAKELLEFLKTILPNPAPALIAAVIKIGDIAFKICPAQKV